MERLGSVINFAGTTKKNITPQNVNEVQNETKCILGHPNSVQQYHNVDYSTSDPASFDKNID